MEFPLGLPTSGNGLDLGGAERVEAVHEGDADLDFGDLTIRISWHDPLAKALQAVHLLPGSGLLANHERVRLDPTSDMVAGPLLPECSSEVSRRAQNLVSRQCCGAVFLPGAAVATDFANVRDAAQKG